MAERRKDSKGRVLRSGESERSSGGYQYRWTTPDKKRHYVYATSLKELREKESRIQKDLADGIRTDLQRATLNDYFTIWFDLKSGIKESSKRHYAYLYEQYINPDLGNRKIGDIKKSELCRFYNQLAFDRNLNISSIDVVNLVLRQIFALAVDDCVIRVNPCDGVLKGLKKELSAPEKRKSLTASQQRRFLNFLENDKQYRHWLPIFTTMLGTGMRVGEVTGLRWRDVDFEKNMIYVNHTLVYLPPCNGKKGRMALQSPKTKAGIRTIPLLSSVKDALLQLKRDQKLVGKKCQVTISDFTDFIFLTRSGKLYQKTTLNEAISRIVRDMNAAGGSEVDPMPRFSCHTLRHTFTTRLIESGANPKIVQDVLGHSDIQTTLNIYADVTEEFKQEAFIRIDDVLMGLLG